jgi:hypothetical protein
MRNGSPDHWSKNPTSVKPASQRNGAGREEGSLKAKEANDDPRTSLSIVTPTANSGAGFDVLEHDGLRAAIRTAVGQASEGQSAAVHFAAIAGNLYLQGFWHGWPAPAIPGTATVQTAIASGWRSKLHPL